MRWLKMIMCGYFGCIYILISVTFYGNEEELKILF